MATVNTRQLDSRALSSIGQPSSPCPWPQVAPRAIHGSLLRRRRVLTRGLPDEGQTNLAQLRQHLREQSFGGVLGSVENRHVHPFDPQDVSRKTGHLLGMKQERVLVILAKLGVQPAEIEGGIQNARVGVGIAVDGGAGTTQAVLNVRNAHQGVRGRRGSGHGTGTGRTGLKGPTL